MLLFQLIWLAWGSTVGQDTFSYVEWFRTETHFDKEAKATQKSFAYMIVFSVFSVSTSLAIGWFQKISIPQTFTTVLFQVLPKNYIGWVGWSWMWIEVFVPFTDTTSCIILLMRGNPSYLCNFRDLFLTRPMKLCKLLSLLVIWTSKNLFVSFVKN